MAEWHMAPVRWLLGSVKFEVAGEAPWRFFTRAAKLGYSLWGIAPKAKGAVKAYARLRALPELQKLAAECDCTLQVEEKIGLQVALERLWARKGLVVGLVLAVLLYGQLGSRVWNITVHGCEAYTPEEVLAAARACGVYCGAKKSSFDPRMAADSMMLHLPGLSWLSLNTRDCFVEIELREAVPKPEREEKEGFSIVSAARAGQVVSCRAMAGKLLVQPGQVVEEGQMLVTGLQETAAGEPLFVNARAVILARTWRVWEETLPVTVEETVATGEEKTRRSLQLFTLQLPLDFAASPLAPGEITRTAEPLTLLGVELPVALHTEHWRGTQVVFRECTEEELYAAAEETLLAKAAQALGDEGTIEERKIELSIRGNICTARLICTCVEDIAVEVPIVITGE